MQAYIDGKEIQFKMKCQDNTFWRKIESPMWKWSDSDYRIKPEPEFRPYTFEEMCEAVKKHGILIKAKNDNLIYTMLGFDGYNVFYINESCETYEQFMANNVWFDDDSPCGVLEE